MAKALDPKYQHIIGPHKCRIEDCQGHTAASSATIHRLYEEFYTSARRVRREKRQEKAEARIVKAVAGRKRVKGLAPRTKKVAPKVETTTEGKKRKGHYHEGRRGRCSCAEGDSRVK